MQMLKNWNPEQIPEKEDIKVRLSAARTRLYELQMALKEHKIPVIVLFEGWGASSNFLNILIIPQESLFYDEFYIDLTHHSEKISILHNCNSC